jgi:AraC-like DNA-binding protein
MIARSCRDPLYRDLKRKHAPGDGISHSRLDPQTFDLLRSTMVTVTKGSLDADLLNREAGFGVDSTFRFEHGDPDALNAGLHYLLLLCWRSHGAGRIHAGAVSLHPAVQKALELLGEDGAEGDLAHLARQCGASTTYLSRLFQREVGVTMRRYRNSARLSRFWLNYRNPRKTTMAEAAFAAGFGSYAQFHRIFRDAYGQGPKRAAYSPEAKTEKRTS